MRKRKFLLIAGILGLAFGAACSFAPARQAIPAKAEETIYADSGSGNAAPAKQWEDKDTGFVIFGVLMGVSACLIATMVTLSILKKRKNENHQEERQ